MRVSSLLPARSLFSFRLAILGILALCLCFPGIAAASGGITEFSSPLERVVNTLTGPAGKWISIVAMALCGVIFIMNKNENYSFIPSPKGHYILYFSIVIRSLFPLSVHPYPVEFKPRVGRHVGTSLLPNIHTKCLSVKE